MLATLPEINADVRRRAISFVRLLGLRLVRLADRKGRLLLQHHLPGAVTLHVSAGYRGRVGLVVLVRGVDNIGEDRKPRYGFEISP